MHMPKTSISSSIQKFRMGGPYNFPIYGKIQGEVVVGTTNGNNLGGSNCLYVLLFIGIIPC